MPGIILQNTRVETGLVPPVLRPQHLEVVDFIPGFQDLAAVFIGATQERLFERRPGVSGQRGGRDASDVVNAVKSNRPFVKRFFVFGGQFLLVVYFVQDLQASFQNSLQFRFFRRVRFLQFFEPAIPSAASVKALSTPIHNDIVPEFSFHQRQVFFIFRFDLSIPPILLNPLSVLLEPCDIFLNKRELQFVKSGLGVSFLGCDQLSTFMRTVLKSTAPDQPIMLCFEIGFDPGIRNIVFGQTFNGQKKSC